MGKERNPYNICSCSAGHSQLEMSDSEDDNTPQLSSHALAALQEFYAEQKQSTNPGVGDKYNVGVIEENWVSECVHVGK